MASDRYVLVDGMRGFAAVSVVLFHIGRDFLNIPILHYGGAGVYVFFVISGFVICHSLIHKTVNARFFALFMLRRSIRLDPSYWVSIALALLVLWLPSILIGYSIDFPSMQTIGLHAFYLQDLTGQTPINIVFWSLCYEIQFYLVFCGVLLIAQKVSQSVSFVNLYTIQAILLLIGLVISLFWPLGLSGVLMPEGTPAGLFINLWYLFLLGCLSYLAINNRVICGVFCITAVGLFLFSEGSNRLTANIGLATAILFLVAGRLGTLTVWLKNAWIQYLGLISYSLYLVHDIIGLYVRDTGLHLAKKYLQLEAFWFTCFWVLFTILICFVCATLMYRYIERPSLNWSKKIRY